MKIAHYFLLITTICILACSDGKLTKSNAESQIIEKDKLPTDGYLTLKYGSIISKEGQLPNYYVELQKKGFVEINPVGVTKDIFYTNHNYQVNLTEKGKKLLIESREEIRPSRNDTAKTYQGKFKSFKIEFVAVKSIHELPALNAAEVVYTIKRSGLTSFAKAYYDPTMLDKLEKEQDFHINFVKTSDGWKIDN